MAYSTSSKPILVSAFNQDFSSLQIGLSEGYKIFSLNKTIFDNNDLSLVHASTDFQEVKLIERLFQSSLVALVTLSAPRKLRILHLRNNVEICVFNYANTILSVQLNRLRMVVCLEDTVQIHNIRDLNVMHTIRDMPRNPHGLCALSPMADEHNAWLAYPISSNTGELQIFDCVQLKARSVLRAHEHPLEALAFNSLGTLLATASDVGTVIRVFSMPQTETDAVTRIAEFSRGVARSVSISSIAFDQYSRLLAVSSNTETVHVFKLDDSAERAASGGGAGPEGVMASGSASPSAEQSAAAGSLGGISSYISWAGKAITRFPMQLLPTTMSEVLTRDRDFATARLPAPGHKTICGFLEVNSSQSAIQYLMVASHDGTLFLFALPNEGGTCTLVTSIPLKTEFGPGAGSSAEGAMSGPASVSPPELSVTASGNVQQTRPSSGGASILASGPVQSGGARRERASSPPAGHRSGGPSAAVLGEVDMDTSGPVQRGLDPQLALNMQDASLNDMVPGRGPQESFPSSLPFSLSQQLDDTDEEPR